MQEHKFWRTAIGGVIAWIVLTIILYVEPAMGIPKMDMPELLGGVFGMNNVAMGWVMHFTIGMLLAYIYTYWLVDYLPGAPWLQGLEYSVLPWLAMMVIVAPMLPILNPMATKMPPGVFLGNMGIMATVGNLIAHLVWGAVLGSVYGTSGLRAGSRHA